MTIRGLAAAALLITGSGLVPPAPGAAALEVGRKFPQLVLPSLEGEPLSVGAFRGRKLMLHVFASW